MEKDHTTEHGRPLIAGFWKRMWARFLPLLKNPLVLKLIWCFFKAIYEVVKRCLDED